MLGELFNAMVDEVVGDDPATRRIAALPYLFSKASIGATALSSAAPAPLMQLRP